MIYAKTSSLEDRITNWRRFYQESIRIECAPYYVPPASGSIINDEIALTRMIDPEFKAAIEKNISQRKELVGRTPVEMQDAMLLESTWRIMPDIAKKTYLKLEKIDQLSRNRNGCFILWRRMKAFGVQIRSHDVHEAYDRKCMDYFAMRLAI